MRFGISFAILASLSTSSTASTFVAVANNLQSKIAVALVSLSSVPAFFDDDAMLMASAVKMPMIRIFFIFKKSPACLCRGARQDERQDLSGPDEFQ